MNHYDVVLHVDKTDDSLNIAFSNALNYAKALTGERFQMVLVVNSRAVTLLRSDNEGIKSTLDQACAQGLAIRVCNNALQANNIQPESLYPQCVVVPAGVVELVDLQRKGFAYIKP